MATSTNYLWAEPNDSDLVKNGALAIRTLGNAIDASVWSIGYGQAGKNKIINGGFDVWQRGTSITIGSDGAAFSADRFKGSYTGTGINVVATQDTSVPNPQTKFSLKLTQTGGNATALTTYAIRNFIEQSTILPLLGRAATLSFWYRSSVTGTHATRINGTENTGGTSQTATFTVTTADTWEYKTIAVTAFSAVTAASANFTDRGAFIDLGPASQSNGQTSFASGAYFQVAQMQLESGTTATPFSRTGGTMQGELAMCQRYYWRNTAGTTYGLYGIGTARSTTQGDVLINFPVTMRSTPAVLEYANLGYHSGSLNTSVFANASLFTNTNNATPNTAILYGTVASGFTTFQAIYLLNNNNTAGYIAFNAEL
jgi:hypothetical protein